jgi:hypothetical protein
MGVANGVNKIWLNGVGHAIDGQRAQSVEAKIRNECGHEGPLYAAINRCPWRQRTLQNVAKRHSV